MERCPNCGTPGRPGAKFCTTCGFRFPGDASDDESAQDDTVATVPANDDESGLFPGAMTDGWPSPPPPAEAMAGGWDQQATAQAAPAEPGEMTEVEATSNTWAAGAADFWPAPPTVNAAETPPTASEPLPADVAETASVDTSDTAARDQTETAETTA